MLPEGYRLRALDAADAGLLAEAYRRNREHLRPWDPPRRDEFFTESGQASAIAEQLRSVQLGAMVAWVLEHEDDGSDPPRRRLVGRVNLNNIVRGALRSGTVGYWVDAEHLGRGLASAAVEHVCAHAEGDGFHRVEAGTLVHNTASQRVLERCGFEYYGTAPSYLFVDGAWQDHRLFQRILHDRPL